jgi:hypothetical protein
LSNEVVQTDKTRELRDDFEVWQYPTVVRVVESVVCKATCVYEAVVALRGDGSPEMPRRGELRHSWQASNLNTTAITNVSVRRVMMSLNASKSTSWPQHRVGLR